MREIQFRAWVKPGELSNHKNGVIAEAKPDFLDNSCFIQRKDLIGKKNFTEIFDFDRVELMQHTGLKDKNGNEIYEGDYIRFTDFDSNQGYEGEVAFKGGAFCMLHKIEGTMRNIIMATMLDVDGYIEIIGNIYENPELLEENQND